MQSPEQIHYTNDPPASSATFRAAAGPPIPLLCAHMKPGANPTRTAALLCTAASLLSGGCSWARSDGLTLKSTASSSELHLTPAIQVYAASDRNTADFYLTDLPPQASAPQADLRAFTGSLVHVHLFLQPKAGSTPIDPGACSVTVRQLIVAGGQAGLYSGGGFLETSSDVGSPECGGTFRGATLRLTAATPGFLDRLGPSEMRAKFNATRNDAQARAWSAVFLDMAARLDSKN